ncbi:hypothetical protein KKF91_10230, partial [Myxococcota bacterium]|nr:hypothetical protein [Myxococcota bacterium]
AAEGAPLRGLAAWRAGLERAALEDWEGAEIAYRAALEVSPDALAPLIGLSRLPARAAARAEALAQLSEAAQSPALRAYAEASRGYLLAPHDPASALAAFTLAAQLDPHAVEPARRALALDPPDPETRRALLLRCLSAPCTPKEALDWLRQLYPLQTGEAALQTLRRLATLDDQDQAVKARLAAALIEAGEIEEGEGLLDEIEASVDIEALDLEGLIALGRLLAPTRAEAAQRLLRRAVSLLDEEGLALEALGEVALARGDARGAEAAYHRMERVVEAPARRAAARIGRARALSALGQEEEARALIKAALKWAAVERDEALRVLLESAKLSRDADEA